VGRRDTLGMADGEKARDEEMQHEKKGRSSLCAGAALPLS
jgi:hypothetical protein